MDLITVFETPNLAEAELVKSRLVAAGIHCIVADESTAFAPLGVRVQVGTNDEQAARDIIDSSESGSE